jgi:hypothetical protein
MIMLSWITKIKLELMAYEAMFATSAMDWQMPSIIESKKKRKGNG